MANGLPPRGYFVCECSNMQCFEPLSITAEQYNGEICDGEYVVASTCTTPLPRLHFFIQQGHGYNIVHNGNVDA